MHVNNSLYVRVTDALNLECTEFTCSWLAVLFVLFKIGGNLNISDVVTLMSIWVVFWVISSFFKAGNKVVFSKWSRTFIEFSEFRKFRESEKSLRRELDSV